MRKHTLWFSPAGQFQGAVQSAEMCVRIPAELQHLRSVLRTVQGGELEFYQYIVNSILVGPKHHYFIQQLPPIDQYYNLQSRQSHHPAPYVPAQQEASRGFHLNHISAFLFFFFFGCCRIHTGGRFDPLDAHQNIPEQQK